MTMHIGHVALRTPDLDAAAAHARAVLGLREVGRDDDRILLTANEKHHELELLRGEAPGFDHVGLEVEDEVRLEVLADRARAAGARVADVPAADGIGRAVRVTGPAGIVYELYAEMERTPLTSAKQLAPGIRKLGHLTFFSPAAPELVAFWGDVLGLRVSDTAENMTWMRCDADHHGLAVAQTPDGPTLLHHHAWEVQDLSALGRYCDAIALQGLALFWGPVRHGPGFNLATYLPDVGGGVIEVYTDLLLIPDDRAYRPVDWSDEPRALNLWGPPPGEDLLLAGVPVV